MTKQRFHLANAFIFISTILICLIWPIVILSAEPERTDPPRLPRKDCFLGVHFDFHAELSDKNIGQNTTREMVNKLIDIVHPDYFEIDTKGHPGISSYPTKVGNHGGSFIGDPLKIWREVTAARGVSLYGHYSGVIDKRAFTLHPDWAALNAQGKPVPEKMSVVGPYSDSLLIPQLIELGKNYGLDGVWIDGDCWGVVYDWSPAIQKAFIKETGVEVVPKSSKEPTWSLWSNFQRELFRKYVKHYIAQVRKEVPKFEFCCNWAFTNQMPEAPLDGIDFISGDICGHNCVTICRYVSRLLATQEVPWDLMSWSFHQWSLGTLDPPKSRKTAIQLKREAASVIAQGGGYQAVFSQAPAGYPPVRDGSIDIEKVKLFGQVAQFCRERQEVCFKASPIPQIALLLTTEGNYHRWDRESRLFWWDHWQEGISNCLIEDRQAVSVLITQNLMKRMNEFPLIIIFQWDYIEPELVEQLGKYVENGGHLYLVGPAMPTLFDKVLRKRQSNIRKGQAPQGRTLDFYTIGKGVIGLTPQINPPVEFVNATVHELFPNPIVKIEGTPKVDLSVMKTVKGEMAIHLVNASGPHYTAGVIEKIDPVGPVKMSIRVPEKPKTVRLEPQARDINWVYKDGKVLLTVDSVPIHEIVVVTP